MNRTLLYISLGGGSFIATVLVCVALQPSGILSHDGLSLYGNYSRTLLPYSIGLVATAYFLLRACRAFVMDSQAAHSFRIGLEAISIGLLGIVATPSLSTVWFIQNLHVVFGFMIFVTQAFLSLRYLRHVDHGIISKALLGTQMLAIVLVILSFQATNVLDIMLPAQVLATVAFGALLLRAIKTSGIPALPSKRPQPY